MQKYIKVELARRIFRRVSRCDGVNMKKSARKKLPANRKQGEPQGFLAIMSPQLSGVLGEMPKSNACMFIRIKNQPNIFKY
jgi:hypothetical protein